MSRLFTCYNVYSSNRLVIFQQYPDGWLESQKAKEKLQEEKENEKKSKRKSKANADSGKTNSMMILLSDQLRSQILIRFNKWPFLSDAENESPKKSKSTKKRKRVVSSSGKAIVIFIIISHYPAHTRCSPKVGWASVTNGWPRLNRHCVSVSCLLGIRLRIIVELYECTQPTQYTDGLTQCLFNVRPSFAMLAQH